MSPLRRRAGLERRADSSYSEESRAPGLRLRRHNLWRPKLNAHLTTGPAASAFAASPAPAPERSAEEILAIILASLDDDKAEDLMVIDLRRKTPLADYMVIANGRSTRHVMTSADKLMERLKEKAGIIARAEGVEQGDWALIDAGDVIVHVFRPEVRDFYTLERIWLAPGEEPLERRNVTHKPALD